MSNSKVYFKPENTILQKPKEEKLAEKNNELIFVKKIKTKENIKEIKNENNHYKINNGKIYPFKGINNYDDKKITKTFEKGFNSDTKHNNNSMFLDQNYTLIPTENIEKLNFLKKEFPILFLKETKICFRIYEISEITGELSVSNYKYGKIKEFIEENKNFLIELENK